jgi:hypothetical protein
LKKAQNTSLKMTTADAKRKKERKKETRWQIRLQAELEQPEISASMALWAHCHHNLTQHHYDSIVG